MAGTCLRLQKEQDSPIHFSFAGPKPSLLITSPLATVMQVHSLASSPSDSARIRFLSFPIPRGGSQGPVSPQCAEEWDKAGGDTSFRDLAMRNDSHPHFTGPGENSSPRGELIVQDLGNIIFPFITKQLVTWAAKCEMPWT